MTRADLLNKKVDQLNSIGEALELISLLNYGECIAVLMNTKNIPSEMHAALMKRAKEANGGTTLELVIAGMDNIQFLGYLISAIITLGGFIAVIMKFIQPINDLRIVIQKLNDTIDALKEDNLSQNKRIEKHGVQIDDLNNRVGRIETKIDMHQE